MAGFHSGRDIGGKTGFLEKACNMRGWKIILLENSGAFEGKFVLLSHSLQDISLIKVVKLSYIMLKLSKPTRPSHSTTGIESNQNGSNEHE